MLQEAASVDLLSTSAPPQKDTLFVHRSMETTTMNITEKAKEANTVLSVHESHLHRMVDFIETMVDEMTQDVKLIVYHQKTASKTNSLIYLNASNPREFIESMIDKHKFVLQALNKVYTLKNDRTIIRGFDAFAKVEESECISHHVLEMMQQLRTNNSGIPVMVKLEVFPARNQRHLVSKVCSLLNKNSISENELDITPADETHTISIIQLDSGQSNKGKKRKRDKHEQKTYLMGYSRSNDTTSPIYPSDSNDICRAFNKLEEAFDRYGHNTKSLPSLGEIIQMGKKQSKGSCIGVDCGSAPGGWTKYLVEKTHCDEVYCIDPGKMDTSVTSSSKVHHLQMTAQNAIPHLRDILTQRKAKVSIWVSDMCVQDVGKQVDIFLLAVKEQVIKSGTAFVLTIKCNVGHARERFDEMANAEAARLKEQVDVSGVEILHLFSNRIGERTIVGCVK